MGETALPQTFALMPPEEVARVLRVSVRTVQLMASSANSPR